MERRAFLQSCAAVAPLVGVIAPAVMKPEVRFSTDGDFCCSMFVAATEKAGHVAPPDRYVLTVHHSQEEYAERVLRKLFTAPYRWQERVIVRREAFRDVDEWTLEGSHAVLRSMGA